MSRDFESSGPGPQGTFRIDKALTAKSPSVMNIASLWDECERQGVCVGSHLPARIRNANSGDRYNLQFRQLGVA